MTAKNINRLKKCLSAIISILLAAAIALSLPNAAEAAETEADLFNNDKVQDVSILIEYEKNDISFKLISPSDAEITKDTDTDTVTVYSGSTSTIIFIGNAEAGQWKIVYDKGSNESIKVSASIQNQDFWITALNKGSMSADKLPLTFTVTSGEDIHYSYSVMLTTDKQSLSGKVLSEGYADTNKEVSTDISFENVSTYSGYYLLLYVCYEKDGSEIFDYAYSDAFDYTNANSPDAIEGVDISIAHDSGSITADWKDYISYDIESVFVEYYIGDELISSSEYPVSEGCQGFFTYEDEASKPLLKISVRTRDGLVSDFAEFEVPLKDDDSISLSLPESGKTGSDIWSFEYKNADNTEVTFEINDKTEKYTLDGDGSRYIKLPEMRNTILVSYRDKNGCLHTYNRTANISATPPTLELAKALDGVTTSNSSIIIAGSTNASEVSINGESVTVSDGIFTHIYKLDKGENHITIEAASGDSSTLLTATVTRTSGDILSSSSDKSIIRTLLPLIIGLAVSAVGIILILLLSGKRKTKNKIENAKPAKPKKQRKPGFVMLILSVSFWLASVGLWVWFIIRKVFENGTGYIMLAYESLQKADSYLLITTVLMIAAIVLSVLAAAFTAIFVIIRISKKN